MLEVLQTILQAYYELAWEKAHKHINTLLSSPEYNEKTSKRVLQNIKQLWKVTIETVIKVPS